ncbi:MAG: GtrA family protein [Demequinaceae bacterium]|nr:GtrA family protein [Demequinaceae bacterium]
MSKLSWQALRYMLVGGFNVGFTLAVFWILDREFSSSIGVQPVYWMSALLGIANGFVWQRIFVWRSANRWHREFARFLVLNLSISATNSFLLFVAVSVMNLEAFPSQVVITCVLVVITFILTRGWVFRTRQHPTPRVEA